MDKDLLDNSINVHAEDEIDIKELFNILKVNKKLVSIITFLSFLIGVFYSFTKPKVWEGEFQIVLDNTSNDSSLSIQNNLQLLFNRSDETLKTEIGILESPLVLTDVFKFVKESKKNKSKDNKVDFSFKKWKKSSLEIELQKGTSILNIFYRDKDKDLIIPVLNNISTKYQSYSKRDMQNEISRTLEYLTSQSNLIEKQYLNSAREFNKFSIDNGLGNIDGFVDLEFNANSKNNFASLNNTSSDAGQRFNMQFQLLEKYEADYIDLSSRLKSNSNTLKQLKNKINNLRIALKRPNEILIKYKELKQKTSRDALILAEINNNLQRVKLEQLKERNPWELISTPELNPNPIAPRKKLISFIFLSLGFLTSYIFTVFKSKQKRIIYNIDSINSEFQIPIISKSYFGDTKSLSSSIDYILKINKISQSEKIGFYVIGGCGISTLVNLKKILDKEFITFNINLIDNLEDIESYSRILIISCSGYSKMNDLKILNQKLIIQNKSTIGLFSLEL